MPIFLLLLLSLLWGSTFYLTKMLLPDFHPVSIVFFRCVFASLALLPFFLWKKTKRDFDQMAGLIVIALLGAGIPWTVMSFSLKGLDTTVGSVINAMGPIFGILLTSFVLKSKVSRQEVLGVSIGFTGILLAFLLGSGESRVFRYESASLLLFSGVLYTLSVVLAGKYLKHCSVFTVSFMTVAVGAIFSSIFMLQLDPYSFQKLADMENLLWLGILGMFNSGFGNVLFYYLIKRGGAVFALLITYVMPFTTIFLGVFLLDEPMGAGTLLALLFVLTGLYITKRRKLA